MIDPSAISDTELMMSRPVSPVPWRALDWGGYASRDPVPHTLYPAPKAWVLVADVPQAYPGSGFTKDFSLTVWRLAVYLPRSIVSKYMRIDWETVGRCIHWTLN